MSELLGRLLAETPIAPAAPYVMLAAGLAVLAFCGNWLVAGSVQLARFFRVSAFVVGLTVVAYGTSMPEMFISVGAALGGSPEIALGNVIGSNIANIGAILAIVALIATIPFRTRALLPDISAMLAATALLFAFGIDGRISRAEGIAFAALLAAYTAWTLIRARKRPAAAGAGGAGAPGAEPPSMRPLAAAALVLASLAGMHVGAGMLVDGAREMALQWGVSERVIAVSIVAVGTSAPELAASLAAAFRKEAELSIGNIIGSNIFNIAGVLGASAIARPLATGPRALFAGDMAWLGGISVLLLLAMLPMSKGKISRLEGGILLAVFAAYMAVLYRGG